MSSDDKEILARISQLAGQINRHKNQQAGVHAVPSHHHRSHTTHRREPYPSSRGYRVSRPSAPHRHRTLIVNGGGGQTLDQSTVAAGPDASASSDASSSWIAKTDRHLQLINSAVYDGTPKAERNPAFRKVNEPCKAFSTTGSCSKGPRCRYIHDATRVAVCRDMLLKGSCVDGDSCDLSHELTTERVPTCLHYLKGNCANPNCPYAHPDLAPGAPICRAFGVYGYCEKGVGCPERHAFECPDFSNTGKCNTKGCKLLHRERASVLRRSNQREAEGDANTNEPPQEAGSPESSKSGGGSVDEVEGLDETGKTDDTDFKTQRDFISF